MLKVRARVGSLKSEYVFFNGAGNLTDARDRFASSILSCKSRPENFRFNGSHTFATCLVQTGVDIYTVQ